MKYLIVMAGLLTASCASYGGTDEDRAALKEDAFAGVTKIGEPENCVRRSEIRSTHVRSDRIIDFDMVGSKTYRNVLPNRCPGLGFEEAFSYRTSINQLCNVEIIRVLRTTGGQIRSEAACGLGQFQQIEKPDS